MWDIFMAFVQYQREFFVPHLIVKCAQRVFVLVIRFRFTEHINRRETEIGSYAQLRNFHVAGIFLKNLLRPFAKFIVSPLSLALSRNSNLVDTTIAIPINFRRNNYSPRCHDAIAWALRIHYMRRINASIRWRQKKQKKNSLRPHDGGKKTK